MEIDGPTPQWINPPPFETALQGAMDAMCAQMEQSFLNGLWRDWLHPTPDRFYQNAMWNVIGDGILPWIPRSRRAYRRYKSNVKRWLGHTLISHDLIEVDLEDW